MVAVPETIEEYCPSCGTWVSYLYFNHETGWCLECSPATDAPRCSSCGGAINPNSRRTTCPTCRREHWLANHADEIEFLIVVKGYTFGYACGVVANVTRPICQCCGKPIKGASTRPVRGKVLFCRKSKACISMQAKFKRLLDRGLTIEAAFATLRSPR